MNIVFWLLAVLGLAALWSLLAFIFVPLGRLVISIITDTLKALTDPEEESV